MFNSPRDINSLIVSFHEMATLTLGPIEEDLILTILEPIHVELVDLGSIPLINYIKKLGDTVEEATYEDFSLKCSELLNTLSSQGYAISFAQSILDTLQEQHPKLKNERAAKKQKREISGKEGTSTLFSVTADFAAMCEKISGNTFDLGGSINNDFPPEIELENLPESECNHFINELVETYHFSEDLALAKLSDKEDSKLHREIILATLDEKLSQEEDEAKKEKLKQDYKKLKEYDEKLNSLGNCAETSELMLPVSEAFTPSTVHLATLGTESIAFEIIPTIGNGNCGIVALLNDASASLEQQQQKRQHLIEVLREAIKIPEIRERFYPVMVAAFEYDEGGRLEYETDTWKKIHAVYLETANEENEQAQKSFCCREEALIAYVNWLSQDRQWLDIESMKVYVEVQNIPLFIWHQDSAGQFKIFYQSPATENQNPDSIQHIHFDNRNHFSVLKSVDPALVRRDSLNLAYMTHVWRDRNPPLTAEELDEINIDMDFFSA